MEDKQQEPAAVAVEAGVDEERKLLQEAIEFVLGCVGDERKCPFCGFIPVSESPESIKHHLVGKHKYRCVRALVEKQIDVDVKQVDVEPSEVVEDLAILDNLDRFDYLYVPAEVKEDAEKTGCRLRWVSRANFRRYADMGAAEVKFSPENRDEMPAQQSTENTQYRSNEMILMKFPANLCEKRDRARKQKIVDNLYARKEAMERVKVNYERDVFDFLVQKKNYDKETARKIAESFSRGAGEGNWQYGSPKSHTGIVIRTKAGEQRIA